MPCPIESFWHCRECLQELPSGISPKVYASISVGLTKEHTIVVWCNRHDKTITEVGVSFHLSGSGKQVSDE